MAGLRALLKVARFNAQGLIPVVIQEAASGDVLTLCYLNRAALIRSLTEGNVYVYRRSQGRLMLKGETSGHIQRIREVRVDCEGQSLLFKVRQRVAACHAGYVSCYFRTLRSGRVVSVGRPVFDPATVYVGGHRAASSVATHRT